MAKENGNAYEFLFVSVIEIAEENMRESGMSPGRAIEDARRVFPKKVNHLVEEENWRIFFGDSTAVYLKRESDGPYPGFGKA